MANSEENTPTTEVASSLPSKKRYISLIQNISYFQILSGASSIVWQLRITAECKIMQVQALVQDQDVLCYPAWYIVVIMAMLNALLLIAAGVVGNQSVKRRPATVIVRIRRAYLVMSIMYCVLAGVIIIYDWLLIGYIPSQYIIYHLTYPWHINSMAALIASTIGSVLSRSHNQGQEREEEEEEEALVSPRNSHRKRISIFQMFTGGWSIWFAIRYIINCTKKNVLYISNGGRLPNCTDIKVSNISNGGDLPCIDIKDILQTLCPGDRYVVVAVLAVFSGLFLIATGAFGYHSAKTTTRVNQADTGSANRTTNPSDETNNSAEQNKIFDKYYSLLCVICAVLTAVTIISDQIITSRTLIYYLTFPACINWLSASIASVVGIVFVTCVRNNNEVNGNESGVADLLPPHVVSIEEDASAMYDAADNPAYEAENTRQQQSDATITLSHLHLRLRRSRSVATWD